MQMVSPSGAVYQAGTLSGNPIAMAAGLAQLTELQDHAIYEHIGQLAKRLAEGMRAIAESLNLTASVSQVESLVCCFFGVSEVTDYTSARQADTEFYAQYFRRMLELGVYLAPSQFEAMFISAAHTEADIDETLQKCEIALAQMV
jgi:glutamate-1-semialdehyde 2,1-aminomutase